MKKIELSLIKYSYGKFYVKSSSERLQETEENYDDTQVRQLIGQKQDIIQDLTAIRSGASAGATAVQPATLNSALSNTVAESGVYDVTANNDNAKFASLSALLNDEDLDTLIPSAKRKGGMSIKFVQSSDNKYMQARCMAQNFTTDVTQWQGVDEEPVAGSKNLVESGGVKAALDTKEETSNKVTSISQSSTDAQYPSANAVANAIGKRGVISQKQTWASGWSSYTMSDIVIGIIPQSAIDLYEEAGATFNENGYQTGIGYFEMNGITDLSYQNIKDAYDFSYHNNGLWTLCEALPRTNFPLCNGINFSGGNTNCNRAISLHLYYFNGRMEVLRLSRRLIESYGASLSQYSGYVFYYRSETLREVMGVMDIGNASVSMYFFSNVPQLKTVKFKGLRANISLGMSSVLSLDSVVYMVLNSENKSAITITLHRDVYAVCQADTTEYTYQGNTYTGIIALATAKNITIATA